MTDEKIKAAKAHWSGRMVSNGMPLADFQDVTTQTQKWDDWCIALSNRGDIHAGLGSESEESGFLLSAGEHYVTAAICYHFGKFLFVNNPIQMKSTHKKAVDIYTKALPYLNPPGERVSIPYNGGTLYGNLRAPNGIKTPPVVILIMGLDSAKEEMFYNEQLFLDRGMATLTFDGPGQGEAEYDLSICPEYEKPVQAVIEFTKTRKDLDGGSIGLWGVSMGGYYAPRAAAFCKNLKGCIALSGPFDLALCYDSLPELTRTCFNYRSGGVDEKSIREIASRMTLKDVAEQIECPLFIVSGSLDRVIPSEHAFMLEKAAKNASEIKHLAVADGGHVVNNRAYKYRQASADWMAKKMTE